MANKKKQLEKKGYVNSFTLIGKAKINDKYTYRINEKSEKSDWIYNSINLGVDCGEKHGVVYCELMGGYGAERDNVVYVHGKDEEGRDDFDNRFTIDWDDRNDPEVLEGLGNLCFLSAALEKDKDNKLVYNNILTPYDYIQYLHDTLQDGMLIKVSGQLKYSLYDGNVQVRKEINRITLYDNEDNRGAYFRQTILMNKDSLGKVDKKTGIVPIHAKVLEYFRDWNGKEVRQLVPLNKTFEYQLDLSKPDQAKLILDKLFKVRKDVTEATFDGKFIGSGNIVDTTIDDLTDDIKALIEIGVYTEEQALAACATSGGTELHMYLEKPVIKNIEQPDGSKVPTLLITEKKYKDEDLILDFMTETANDEEEIEEESAVSSDSDWLSML